MSNIVIVLSEQATEQQVEEVIERAGDLGSDLNVHDATLLSLSGDAARVTEVVDHLPGVVNVAGIPADYPKASVAARCGARTTVQLGDWTIGARDFTVIAGPCAVETREQVLAVADRVAEVGAHAIRGGVFKPRTSPYAFQGLGADGLALLAEARERTGLPLVTEVLDVRDLEILCESVDMLQIGARNMQNYALLREVGRCRRPVLLKRGLAATLDETLLAAEYVLDGGNTDVVLCERGIRTFENSYRFTLDLTAITVLRERTHLPVVVDPSHAAGESHRVIPLALAAAASGADGIIVETHCDPSTALCDGKQAVRTSQLGELMERLRLAAASAGRTLRSPAAVRRHRVQAAPTAVPQPVPLAGR